MEEFQKLGALAESRWKTENYNEQRFPEIAGQALSESDLPGRVDPWEIIRWVHTAGCLPQQSDIDGRFGNPPITLRVRIRWKLFLTGWRNSSRTRVLGSKETNALGMPEFDDSYVFVLECLLQGLSMEEANQKATGQYPPENAAELITRVPALTEALRGSTLFKYLLAD